MPPVEVIPFLMPIMAIWAASCLRMQITFQKFFLRKHYPPLSSALTAIHYEEFQAHNFETNLNQLSANSWFMPVWKYFPIYSALAYLEWKPLPNILQLPLKVYSLLVKAMNVSRYEFLPVFFFCGGWECARKSFTLTISLLKKGFFLGTLVCFYVKWTEVSTSNPYSI